MNVLSIDLGTSNTVAVLAAHGGPPRVVDLDGASAMPSAVFATEDGRLVAGREAVRLARLTPARFEPNPKRRVDEDNLLLGDAVVPVPAALAAVLGKVLTEVTRQLGGAWPDEVRLTHPAQWGSARCAVLLTAARQAGLAGNVHLVPEPVAAAARFAELTGGHPLAPGQALAVYDLGAGTFDVAVVGAGRHGFTVLAESGLADLGGLDLDQALLDHLGGQHADRDPDGWQRLIAPESTEDRRAARALREDVRIAKEALSEHPQTEVALPEPFGAGLVTRAELESVIEPGLRRSVELLGATAQRAGLDAGRLAGVYLVGGSSRIPLVAKLIAARFGIVPTALDQPETAVALGAHQVNLGDLAARTNQVHAQQPWPVPAPRKHRRAVLISALSVVLVVAAVAVIVLAPWRSTTASSSESPSAGPNGKDGFHWAATAGEKGGFVGLWTTANSVVLGSGNGFTAYNVETGEELWSWEVPDEHFVCNMTDSLATGYGAFTYGTYSDAEDCHYLQTISAETGKLRWKDAVTLVADGYQGWLGKIGGTSLSISETVVTAPYAGANAPAEHSTDVMWVDARTGEVKGKTDVGAQSLDYGCKLTGYAQAMEYGIIVIATCSYEPAPMLLRRGIDDETWLPAGDLTGCREISNILDSAFTYAVDGTMLVGCTSVGLDHLYQVTRDGHSNISVDLGAVAVDAVESGGGAGALPSNLALTGENLYLLRGAEDTSDGVVAVAVGTGRAWEHRLSGFSEARLMAATDESATVLTITPGPAAFYTVTSANQATKGPAPAPGVADRLPDAEQAVRVGDYLVCGFNSYGNDDAIVIGVVRAA